MDEGRWYVAEIYAGGADGDWRSNPTALDISQREVERGTGLKIRLAAGGGQAIRFRPVELDPGSRRHCTPGIRVVLRSPHRVTRSLSVGIWR